MPYDTEFAKTGAHVRLHGTVSFDEIRSAQGEVWGHPDWDYIRYVIVDFLEVETFVIVEGDAQALGFMDKTAVQRGKELKVALVAVKPDIIQLFEAYASILDGTTAEVRIFADREEAIAWAKSL